MVVRKLVRIALFLLMLLSGVGLFAFLIYQQGLKSVLDSILGFGFWPFFGFVVISLINFIFYSYRWQLITNRHLKKEDHVSLPKMYIHRMGGFAVSYLTPAAQVGGEPVRMALLSSEKNVSLKQSTSSVLLDIAFEISAYILFIFAGAIFAIAAGFGDSNSLVIIFVSLGVMIVLLTSFFYFIARGKGFFGPLFRFLKLDKFKKMRRYERAILETEEMMRVFLSKNPKLVLVVSLLSVLVISFRVIEVFYIAYFFDVYLNFGQAFLMSTLPGIALLLPVPAGIGVFEGGFAAIFGVLAIPLNAIAFALIIRSRDIVFIIVGSIHILQKGSSFLKEKILKPVFKS